MIHCSFYGLIDKITLQVQHVNLWWNILHSNGFSRCFFFPPFVRHRNVTNLLLIGIKTRHLLLHWKCRPPCSQDRLHWLCAASVFRSCLSPFFFHAQSHHQHLEHARRPKVMLLRWKRRRNGNCLPSPLSLTTWISRLTPCRSSRWTWTWALLSSFSSCCVFSFWWRWYAAPRPSWTLMARSPPPPTRRSRSPEMERGRRGGVRVQSYHCVGAYF